MACCLVSAKPLFEPLLEYCQFEPQEQTSVKFESKYIFIQENACENVVCEKAAILSWPQCGKRHSIAHSVLCGSVHFTHSDQDYFAGTGAIV